MVGREQLIVLRFAEALLPGEALMPDFLDRARNLLEATPRMFQAFFRLTLFLFEWSPCLHHAPARMPFSSLPLAARTRYLQSCMTCQVSPIRQLFLIIRFIVVLSHFDHPAVSSRWIPA